MTDAYLSPSRPHLRLATENDLVSALAEGLLVETPQRLAGQRERVDQVLLTVPDPPLLVTTTVIPSAADPELGYLVIHVPTSPSAPHMVDHRYLGRGEATKRYLSDPEVRRLHQRHAHTDDDALVLLQREIDKDPSLPRRTQAHLFLLAEPVTGPRGMLAALTTDDGAQARIHNFPRAAGVNPVITAALEASRTAGCVPDVGDLLQFQTRAGGVAEDQPGPVAGSQGPTRQGLRREHARAGSANRR